MVIMENYRDLVRMIDLMESQLELLEGELSYWWPFGSDKKGNAEGFHKYPLDVSTKKYDMIQDQIHQTKKILDFYRTVKNDMDEHILLLEGLEFQIAYRRIVESKNYKEIAKELGYSYDYIREVASKSKKPTIIPQTS